LFEALTLIQTRVSNPSDYHGRPEFCRVCLLDERPHPGPGNIDRADLMIFNIMDDPDEIVAYIRKPLFSARHEEPTMDK
jgi:hypothetical protein